MERRGDRNHWPFLTTGNMIKGMFDPVLVSPRGGYLFLLRDGKSLC